MDIGYTTRARNLFVEIHQQVAGEGVNTLIWGILYA